MVTAFMEGRNAAKAGRVILANPYRFTIHADAYKAQLWDDGFISKLVQDVRETTPNVAV